MEKIDQQILLNRRSDNANLRNLFLISLSPCKRNKLWKIHFCQVINFLSIEEMSKSTKWQNIQDWSFSLPLKEIHKENQNRIHQDLFFNHFFSFSPMNAMLSLIGQMEGAKAEWLLAETALTSWDINKGCFGERLYKVKRHVPDNVKMI